MGISLNGLTPAGTYPGLIKTGDNTAISGTPKVLSDGNGNNLPMEVSTTGVNLTGSPTVNSVAIANTTQVAAKQDTLVSGTNIKTINGASLLGSGNIPVVTSPSGVSGAIQFSNGSAFASDATTFFWDNINKRLGIGTNSPASPLSVVNTIALSAGATNPRIGNIAYTINNTGAQTGTLTGIFLNATETNLNGQAHNLMDLQIGGVSQFRISKSDATIYASNYNFSASVYLGQAISMSGSGGVKVGNSRIRSDADGNLTLLNDAANSFSLLKFGGTTSSFPSIKRNGTAIDFRFGDDSGFCPVNTGVLSIQNTVATAVSVASTHKVTVVIGGTTYYLLASNV
jgi:hypothetical protein